MRRRAFLGASLATLTFATTDHAQAVTGGLMGAGGGGGVNIGGFFIGQAVTSGFYSGYTLQAADDFLGTAPDVITPANAHGRYGTTRCYSAGARSTTTGSLANLYDTDPFMTGFNDSNRGVAVGYSNMSQSGSILTITERNSTTGEKVNTQANNPQLAGMIHMALDTLMNAGASGTGDVIFEIMVQMTAPQIAPAGVHPTFPWIISWSPTIANPSDGTYDSNEVDISEGNSQQQWTNYNKWTNGGVSGSTPGGPYTLGGTGYRLVTFVQNTTKILVYIDGVQVATSTFNSNSYAVPQYILMTLHSLNNYQGENYSQASWDANPAGYTVNIDWWRMWSRTAQPFYTPLTTIPDVNVDYGAAFTVNLPSVAALWGNGSVTDYIQACPGENNEPGVTTTVLYNRFPAGVSYNSGTRVLSGTIGSGAKGGRMIFGVAVIDQAGTCCKVARFAVNVGPNYVGSASYTQAKNSTLDLYPLWDCGVLTSDINGNRDKTMTATCPATGFSYNDATGLITFPSVTGTFTVTTSCTNNQGQTKSGVTFTITVA